MVRCPMPSSQCTASYRALLAAAKLSSNTVSASKLFMEGLRGIRKHAEGTSKPAVWSLSLTRAHLLYFLLQRRRKCPPPSWPDLL
jgi:hypothetical protein